MVDTCVECGSENLSSLDEPAKKQCEDCATKMRPCTADGCDGTMKLERVTWVCQDDDCNRRLHEV